MLAAMRILFTASDWPGHYFCMVPMAWAFQAAGHEVRVACMPGQATRITHAGLVPVPVLEGVDMGLMARLGCYVEAVQGRRTLPGLPVHPLTGDPLGSLDEFDVETHGPRIGAMIAEAIRRSHDGAVAFARQWRPDLVCHDLTADEGALAARVIGVPAVFCPPGLFGSVENEPGLRRDGTDPTNSFERHGVAPWTREQIGYAVDPSPESALPPFGTARRFPVRYVPYNGPGAQPDWAARRPAGQRVVVLWGSSSADSTDRSAVLLAAVTAAMDASSEVIVTTAPGPQPGLDRLPAGVRRLENFPLRLLLAEGDAIIHHGSSNALMTAAAAGVPQVALAVTDDHIAVSNRLARTGAVRVAPALTAEPDEVAAATLAVLTEPGYREAALVVRAELAATATPAQLVPQLAALADAR
jgi:UDP:flavonoid glycosyltransferase YjiC (YdhE family)